MTPPLPRPGTVFAGYLLERLLGAGGMGTVYAARHPRLPRRDAVKILASEHGDSPEFRARFLREADLAARLDHPNIVSVHDRGVDEGRLWIAMQFVDGTDAGGLIRKGPEHLGPDRIAHIVCETARGLDAAHRAGLLHRDVKPANILIEPRPGRSDRVLVSDFGIAKAAAETTALTRTGDVLATLAYAAPEQLSLDTVDHRADVYALGCTVFELLTGSKPFPRPNPGAVISAHLFEPPPRPSALNPALPQAIDDVIIRAMAKDPAHRYHSCGSFADDVSAVLRGHPRADGATRSDRTAPTVVARALPVRSGRRTPRARLSLIASAAALAAGVAVAVAVVMTDVRDRSPDTASPAPPSTPRTAQTWGGYDYMVQAFPALLPKTPDVAGAQGLRCTPVDADGRQLALDAPVTGIRRLRCTGNQNPVEHLTVACSEDRGPATVAAAAPNAKVAGEENWRHGTGDGWTRWEDDTDDTGHVFGTIVLTFTDSYRKPCSLTVSGGSSGQDLRDRWWPNAPL